MRRIFNSSKSILKSWEAFSISRKAFSKHEKHFQFLEKHSQSVRSILNFSRSILKARETFSTLRKSIRKTPEKGEIILNFQTKHFNSGVRHSEFFLKKNHSYLGQEKACPRKGILSIPWRHSENAHRFGQHRHDFLSKASRVQLENWNIKIFFWGKREQWLKCFEEN